MGNKSGHASTRFYSDNEPGKIETEWQVDGKGKFSYRSTLTLDGKETKTSWYGLCSQAEAEAKRAFEAQSGKNWDTP